MLLTTLQQHAVVLRGPEPADLLRPVPPSDLRRSLHDSLALLLDDLVGDERNVLLTLARMLVTLETGEIVSKHEAVRRILPVVAERDRAVLALAASGYLGQCKDDWSHRQGEAHETAARLAAQIRASNMSLAPAAHPRSVRVISRGRCGAVQTAGNEAPLCSPAPHRH